MSFHIYAASKHRCLRLHRSQPIESAQALWSESSQQLAMEALEQHMRCAKRSFASRDLDPVLFRVAGF